MNVPEKVAARLRELPDKPGCYIMRDKRGRIIYVGKAASLRKRVQSYFRQATLRSADPKLRGLIKSVDDLEIMVARSEAEAILTEGRLIKDYRPRYNVSFRDDKRFLLLRVDPADPFPRFELCRIRREDGSVHLGPFASSAAARATLDFTEKRFGLRKCHPREPGAEDYKHCINDIVRFCSAPCVAKVTPAEYHERVALAIAFLRGDKPEYLKEIERDMTLAAEKRDFERAAALRDTLFSLRQAIKQRARLAVNPEMRIEDARAGVEALRELLGLACAPATIEAFDISNISGTYAVASMVCAVDGIPRRNRYRRFRIRTVEGSDDPRMMAEVIRRRFTRLKNEDRPLPDLVLIDGGLTQLRAARAELAALALERVPTAGLAKRFEEIYWLEGLPPLRLPRDSKALQVLQRLRDEAHRFALTYHRHLRSRRLRESILDEVEGIGKKRKELLLRHFGSIRRLLRASPEMIAEVPGIGEEMARAIHAEVRSLGAEAETDGASTEA